MTNQHPITPPSELVQQWYQEADNQLFPYYVYIADQASQWGADQQLKLDAEQIAQSYQAGADQELEACCKWLYSRCLISGAVELRAARRPKPPTLKERALALIDSNKPYLDDTAMNTIRRALEQLD
jgi:hypothetical protein